MSGLTGRHIVLGVTGSVAAFKAAALASRLTTAGAEVRTIMTAGAERFVSRLTFEAVTGQPVTASLWDERMGVHIGHIDLARWGDLLLVAPASAGSIARLALGLADDALAAVALATPGPLVLAPAMETQMFRHPATQENLARLSARGACIVGPATGRLASGATGEGRLAEIDEIVAAVEAVLRPSEAQNGRTDLSGMRVLISAGPTREPIDPVRYLSNRSSGKMGYALASVARARGADVVLVSGPVDEGLTASLPDSIKRIDVETAAEMHDMVLHEARQADIIIMAAAVADFRPKSVRAHKIKKGWGLLQVELESTTDILEALKRVAPQALLVGFAAETQDPIANARDKLYRKGLALIIANDVSGPDSPFGSDYNQVTLITRDDPVVRLPRLSKREVANHIIDAAVAMLQGQLPSQQTPEEAGTRAVIK